MTARHSPLFTLESGQSGLGFTPRKGTRPILATDATFLYLFNKAHLQEFGQVLQAWMIS
jgi:hypothetical protein